MLSQYQQVLNSYGEPVVDQVPKEWRKLSKLKVPYWPLLHYKYKKSDG